MENEISISVDNKNEVISILNKRESLTGKELLEESGIDELTLWRICNKSKKIVLKIVGKRYLRLDRNVKDYARLSPSIKREFITYTVCGLEKKLKNIEEKRISLQKKIKKISKKKYKLAKDIILNIVENNRNSKIIKENVCFIIAGDIVFNMAHSEPRPELSTGKLVRGSDLDIIIIAKDKFSKSILDELDREIYREKYMYIKNPAYREEIDYNIKNISKTKNQLQFDRFEYMVASKILNEGELLYGNKMIFDKIKNMLIERKIPDKLDEIEKAAIINRKHAKSYLLKGMGPLPEEECMKLFYTREETEEIF